MNAQAQIAQHLNVAEAAIIEIQEWAHVLFVKFVSGRPRFVSKKVVKKMDFENGNKWEAEFNGNMERWGLSILMNRLVTQEEIKEKWVTAASPFLPAQRKLIVDGQSFDFMEAKKAYYSNVKFTASKSYEIKSVWEGSQGFIQ